MTNNNDNSVFSEINDPFSVSNNSIDIVPFGTSFFDDQSLSFLNKNISCSDLQTTVIENKAIKNEKIKEVAVKVETKEIETLQTVDKKKDVQPSTSNSANTKLPNKPTVINKAKKQHKRKHNYSSNHYKNRYVPYHLNKFTLNQCYYEKNCVRKILTKTIHDKMNFLQYQNNVNYNEVLALQHRIENQYYYHRYSQAQYNNILNKEISNLKYHQSRYLNQKANEFDYAIKEINEAITIIASTIKNKRKTAT